MDFESDLHITSGTNRVSGRSILELMTLSAACGSELEIFAEGKDAEPLVQAVAELILGGFGELS